MLMLPGSHASNPAFQQAITCKILILFAEIMMFFFFSFRFLSNEGMLLGTAIATESETTQNYQILSKSAQK
jgi:hypothetical protein